MEEKERADGEGPYKLNGEETVDFAKEAFEDVVVDRHTQVELVIPVTEVPVLSTIRVS